MPGFTGNPAASTGRLFGSLSVVSVPASALLTVVGEAETGTVVAVEVTSPARSLLLSEAVVTPGPPSPPNVCANIASVPVRRGVGDNGDEVASASAVTRGFFTGVLGMISVRITGVFGTVSRALVSALPGKMMGRGPMSGAADDMFRNLWT